jgi:hypothetical protein
MSNITIGFFGKIEQNLTLPRITSEIHCGELNESISTLRIDSVSSHLDYRSLLNFPDELSLSGFGSLQLYDSLLLTSIKELAKNSNFMDEAVGVFYKNLAKIYDVFKENNSAIEIVAYDTNDSASAIQDVLPLLLLREIKAVANPRMISHCSNPSCSEAFLIELRNTVPIYQQLRNLSEIITLYKDTPINNELNKYLNIKDNSNFTLKFLRDIAKIINEPYFLDETAKQFNANYKIDLRKPEQFTGVGEEGDNNYFGSVKSPYLRILPLKYSRENKIVLTLVHAHFSGLRKENEICVPNLNEDTSLELNTLKLPIGPFVKLTSEAKSLVPYEIARCYDVDFKPIVEKLWERACKVLSNPEQEELLSDVAKLLNNCIERRHSLKPFLTKLAKDTFKKSKGFSKKSLSEGVEEHNFQKGEFSTSSQIVNYDNVTNENLKLLLNAEKLVSENKSLTLLSRIVKTYSNMDISREEIMEYLNASPPKKFGFFETNKNNLNSWYESCIAVQKNFNNNESFYFTPPELSKRFPNKIPSSFAFDSLNKFQRSFVNFISYNPLAVTFYTRMFATCTDIAELEVFLNKVENIE